MCVLHHVTWSVNSVCHFFGRRRFDTDDESTNVIWVALLSFGEGWHHNHHAFPRSAKHGLRWYEPDLSGLFIRGLERLHLAWNVVTITPERQRQRLAASAGSADRAPSAQMVRRTGHSPCAHPHRWNTPGAFEG